MLNRILAIRWIKNKVVIGQSYEYAAHLRDIEKNLLDKYKPDWRNEDYITIDNISLKQDTSNSMSKQYWHILEYLDDPMFQKYNPYKFNLKELAAKEFIQVIRDENLTKLLE